MSVHHQPRRLPSYQHERLRLSANSIRLVQIHGSSSKTAPLSLRITQYAKHRRPSYAAISYTWGSAAHTRAITINGKPFEVHANLHHLLLHLRQRGESRFLWVDALCIDQANLAERNFHVQLMAQIYDEAAIALVWLGLPSDDRREARAMDFIVEMARHIDHGGNRGGATFSDLYLNDKSHDRWLNLHFFCFQKSYWSRTWVIQEFLQAQHLEVHCGIAQIDWTTFSTVFTRLRELSLAQSLPGGALGGTLGSILTSVPARLTARRLSSRATPLEELLHEFYDAQCSEPRDKVYGMLGIAEDCGKHPETGVFRGPQPDYSKHIVDVYLDVVAYLRDQSPTQSISPLTVLLLHKSLKISPADIVEFLGQLDGPTLEQKLVHASFYLKPSYINVITDTIPAWTSIPDLRQRLDQFDWSKYVGYSIQRKPPKSPALAFALTPSSSSTTISSLPPTSPRPTPGTLVRNPSSTQQVVGSLPDDMVTNALALAEVNPSLSYLYNYAPISTGFHVPLELINMTHEEKRIFTNNAANNNNITTHHHQPLQKPTLIIEHSASPTPTSTPTPRLGLTTPGVRRKDLICQFPGLNVALLARLPPYGGQSLQLVGRAIMVRHAELVGREMPVHPVCGRQLWASACLEGEVGIAEHGGEVLETDALSMFEILREGEG